METELLDHVNNHNQVLGKSSSKKIHAYGLKHRSSHLIIYYNKYVFLQLRHWKKNIAPNCWDVSVAGHVKAGENYLACIIRETKEELGINCNNSLVKLSYTLANKNNGWEFNYLYKMQHPGPFILNKSEILNGKWFNLTNLLQLLKNHPCFFSKQLPLLLNTYIHSI